MKSSCIGLPLSRVPSETEVPNFLLTLDSKSQKCSGAGGRVGRGGVGRAPKTPASDRRRGYVSGSELSGFGWVGSSHYFGGNS